VKECVRGVCCCCVREHFSGGSGRGRMKAGGSNLRYNPIEVLSDQKHPEGDAQINQGHFGLVSA